MFAINKQEFSSFNKNQQSFTPGRDLLVEIKEYDVERASMKVLAEDGKVFIVKVSKSAIERNKKFEGYSAKYFGHLIDDRMKTHIPVGSMVVLERVTHFDKISNCTRVLSCTDHSPEKLFSGLFTIASESNKTRVVSVQSWSKESINQNDKDSIIKFVKKLEEQSNSTEKYPHRYGFMLRALKERADGDYDLVDSSAGFDYIPDLKDEDGSVIEKGRLIDRKLFISACQEYAKYLKDGNVEYDKIDILTYRNYKFSVMSKHAEIKEQSPLFKMVNYKTKGSVGDEKVLTEKHLAVHGIISLTSDEMHRNGRDVTFSSRDLVTHLFANAQLEDIRLAVLSDGKKVYLSDFLAVEDLKVKNNEIEIKNEDIKNEDINKEALQFYTTGDDIDELFAQ